MLALWSKLQFLMQQHVTEWALDRIKAGSSLVVFDCRGARLCFMLMHHVSCLFNANRNDKMVSLSNNQNHPTLHQILAVILLCTQILCSGAEPEAVKVAASSAAKVEESAEWNKIRDIQDYLEANPDADDREEAFAIIWSAAQFLGDAGLVRAGIEGQYEELVKLENGLDAGILAELLVNYLESTPNEARGEAELFFTKIASDVEGRDDEDVLQRLVDRAFAKLSLIPQKIERDITFVGSDGTEVRLSELRGRWVVIQFGASWAAEAWINSLQNLAELFVATQGKPLAFVCVAIEEQEAEYRKLVEQTGLPWTLHWEKPSAENSAISLFGIEELPTTLIVNPQGQMIGKGISDQALKAFFQEQLDL